jgi:hypothetical protein
VEEKAGVVCSDPHKKRPVPRQRRPAARTHAHAGTQARRKARTEGALERKRDAEEGQADDGQEAVAQDGADAPHVDLLDGEEVQHQVHGKAARDPEAVDVAKVHLGCKWAVVGGGGEVIN